MPRPGSVWKDCWGSESHQIPPGNWAPELWWKVQKASPSKNSWFPLPRKGRKRHAPYVWVSGWNITGCLRTAFASSFVHAQAQLAKIKAPKGRHFEVFTPRIWIVTERCKKPVININIWVESSTGFGPGFDSNINHYRSEDFWVLLCFYQNNRATSCKFLAPGPIFWASKAQVFASLRRCLSLPSPEDPQQPSLCCWRIAFLELLCCWTAAGICRDRDLC